jgi:hypothetical protein
LLHCSNGRRAPAFSFGFGVLVLMVVIPLL